MILRRVRNLLRYLAANGPRRTVRYVLHYYSEVWHEWRLGIRTHGTLNAAELGFRDPCFRHYEPTHYRSIYRALRWLRKLKDQDLFLDYVAGMGRVVITVATRPFRRVVGVEVLPRRLAITEDNPDPQGNAGWLECGGPRRDRRYY